MDELTRTHNIEIMCGYVLKNGFQREQYQIYERISVQHTQPVVPSDGLSAA
jgi:hypothetical protein